MKLITRTFLFMTGLVLIQALLAFNFLSLSLTRMSHRDGANTLNHEKAIVQNHFTQFYDLIWRDLIHIKHTEILKNASIDDYNILLPLLIEEIHTENFDYLTLSRGGRTEGLNLQNPYGNLPVSRLPETQGKWHPSVVILEKDNSLYMTGSLRIESGVTGETPLIFHLYKELDNDFCKELAYDTLSGIILINGNKAYSGTIDPAYYIAGIQSMLINVMPENGERLLFDQYFYNKSYNLMITHLKHMEDRSKSVEVVIFSPNMPLKLRMAAIKQQFFFISILCLLLAVIISYGISKTITRPVHELYRAMDVLRKGLYPRVNPSGRSTEIRHLYKGFNMMADSLRADAVKQKEYIKEITFLGDYNERIMDSIQEGIAVIDHNNRLTKRNSAFNKFFFCEESGFNPVSSDLPFWNSYLQEKLELIRKGELNNFNRVSQSNNGKVYDIRLYQLHRAEEEVSSCIIYWKI